MAVMNESGDVVDQARRIYDEAKAEFRSGRRSAEGVEAAAAQIEALTGEVPDEVAAEQIQAAAEAVREVPALVSMDRKYDPVRRSRLLDQADAIFEAADPAGLDESDRLERARNAYHRLSELPQGTPEEEHAVCTMINQMAERVGALGGELR